MKPIGCKNFIKQIDELELGQAPAPETRTHLQECASCSSFYHDRVQLRELVAGLEKVEAPGDFDFRLRARLANESSKQEAQFSIAGLRFGLPSVALTIIALLVGVGLYSRFLTEPQSQEPGAPTVTQSSSPPAPLEVSPASQVNETNPPVAVSNERSTASSSELLVDDNKTKRPDRRVGRDTHSNVRRENFFAKSETATVFPLEATEPLRVSVDYATGTSKTISLPAVSFGSQQVVAQGASMVKTSARTVW